MLGLLGFREELPLDWRPYQDADRVSRSDRDQELRDRNQRNLVTWRWRYRKRAVKAARTGAPQ